MHPKREATGADRVRVARSGGRRGAGIAAAFLAFGALCEARGQGAVYVVPAPPNNVVAAKAYSVLERTCARCHQVGRLERHVPGGGIANILSLGEIAADPSLVRAGEPDASRLYNIALTRERHHEYFNDPGVAEPSASDVQALRDWLSELAPPPRDPACGGLQRISPAEVISWIDAATARMEPERARQTRFLSLVPHYNACVSEPDLAALRVGVDALLAGMIAPTVTTSVGNWLDAPQARQSILALSLTSLGWDARKWEALVQGYALRGLRQEMPPLPLVHRTGTAVPVVSADWFAHAVLPAEIDTRPSRELLRGLPPPAALAYSWRRPAGLQRAAADLGLEPDDLARRLLSVEGPAAVPARKLLGGGVANRDELDVLATILRGRALPASAEQGDRHEIALSADKTIYRAGDTATFTFASNRDCYLTLVGIDKGGRATVLFPNELEPANWITAGTAVRVPGEGAAYRFRFRDKGRESVVAMCSRTRPAPEGVVHDYERLRFTVLGDWQLFLRERPEMSEARRDDAATDVPRPQARQRRRGRPPEVKSGPTLTGLDLYTRTAITIVID